VVNYNHSLISIGFSGSQLRDLERNSKALWKQLCSTDSVLQICRDITKEQLFGSADVNVKYASAVAARMCDLGHEVKLVFSTRRQVLTDVSSIVLNEELARRKKLKQSMNGAERNKYVLDDKFLNDALGFEKGPQYRFLGGILFAPSSSKVIVPHLQDVFQANGAHTSFGKYTLFSAYGTTANGNMSPLAFGIMFGNKDTGNWTNFWEFVKEIHPSVNDLKTQS